jgi:RHS repeat-associated protein
MPGQVYDLETGQFYNYFRDYDPSTGRYAQFDRLGLRAGINGYVYVRANPLRFVDPLGLEVKRWARAADIGPGGVAGLLVDHHWLQTDTIEAGMGPATGEIPAQNGESSLPGVPVVTVDHKGEPHTKEIPIPFPVDEQCVNDLIRPGQDLGTFGKDNNCQSFSDRVLEACRINPATGKANRWHSGLIR